MRSLRPVLAPLLASVLGLGLGLHLPAGAAGEDALKALKDTVLRALDDKDPAKRALAFQPLQTTHDARALEVVVEGERKVAGMVEKAHAEQQAAEQAYEKSINDLKDLERKYAEKNDQSPRATEAYNKIERKISKSRDAALDRLRNLEAEYARLGGLENAGLLAAAGVLARLEPTNLDGALDYLDRIWLRSPDPSEAVRFVDTVGGVTAEAARVRVRKVAGDATLASRVRALAVSNLADRKDDSLPESIVGYLQEGREQFALVDATIDALARVHRQGGIEPLIAFLGRQDVGVLRTRAHEALMSLTGQTHGPYQDPWMAWWKEAKAAFHMPEKPTPKRSSAPQGKGVTFYGVTTFSDRIVFLLDISGSMDQPDQAGKPQPDRLTVARKELLGSIFGVDDGHRFNVVLFNHEVVPWQPTMVVANEEQRRKAKEWIESRQPAGGTNIHDALEFAFGLATRGTGEPLVDTLFFLTDGTPTAGKVQDPQRILELVREWNRTAHLTIHCVAVGESDHTFLRALAEIGHGTCVER